MVYIINPKTAYNEGRFKKAMKDLSKLESLVGGLKQDSSNPEFVKNTGKLLQGDEAFYANIMPQIIRNDLDEATNESTKKMIEYSEKNYNTLFGKLDGEAMLIYLTNVNLYETGNKETDKVVKAVKEKQKITQVKQNHSQGAYVGEKMKKAEEWRQKAFYGFASRSPAYIDAAFRAYELAAEKNFTLAVTREDGKSIDECKLARTINGSLNKAEQAGKADQYYELAARLTYEKVK